jgi:hypothetical protein
MSYTCHVWQVTSGGDKPLPPCGVAHRTVEAAMGCRVRLKGEEPCHRWEIRGGDIPTAKGAGPVEHVVSGNVQAVEWRYIQDYLQHTTRIQIFANRARVVDYLLNARQRMVVTSSHAEGMAMMLSGVLRADPEIVARLVETAQAAEPEELPANVVRGPWK